MKLKKILLKFQRVFFKTDLTLLPCCMANCESKNSQIGLLNCNGEFKLDRDLVNKTNCHLEFIKITTYYCIYGNKTIIIIVNKICARKLTKNRKVLTQNIEISCLHGNSGISIHFFDLTLLPCRKLAC